jgi:DNA polymerase-3 subunit alpha
MVDWFPLHVHTHYSLLDGLSKPEQLAHRAVKLGYGGCAITDHGSISGAVDFVKAMGVACKHCGHGKQQHSPKGELLIADEVCPGYEKAKLKPILGCEFYLCQQDSKIQDKSNNSLSHLCVLAKNREAWKSLIQASSASNSPERFYRKPRLTLEELASFSNNGFIAFSGHLGSDMASILFADPKAAYSARDLDTLRGLLHPEWRKRGCDLAAKYVGLFGKDNFFIEIQLIDGEHTPAAIAVSKCLRVIAKDMGLRSLATCDAHYATQEDAGDQRVVLASNLRINLEEIRRQMEKAEQGEDQEFGLSAFFRSRRYHVPSFDELRPLHTEEELHNAVLIADMCETYDLTSRPMLPQFTCPDGKNPDEFIRELCRKGWFDKYSHITKNHPKRQEYGERVKYELEVITEAGLSSYFLIVWDIVKYAHDKGWLTGLGRGSAAGCMVSNLLDITDLDPIEYDLDFDRFYNKGRNTKDRVSLPDIDCDFEVTKRGQIIDYIRKKYGHDKVCQISTFGRMQGRGALKAVFRAHARLSYDEMNEITKHIPQDASISDDLQEMMEDTGESSIIRWALENNASALKPYCVLNEDGTLDGPLAPDFAQAMRLEGTKKSRSKHASGVVISPIPLADVCPMVYDASSGEMVAGFEMNAVESMGLVKFDILGVTILDKMAGAVEFARTGKFTKG